MFDLHFFTNALSIACPQIRLIPHEDDLADVPSVAEHFAFVPKELGQVKWTIDFASTWRLRFEEWLQKSGPVDGFSASSPLLAAVHPSFFEFPTAHDSNAFVATFGRIVRFNEDTRRLAAVVLYALDKKHSLGINPGETGIPASGKFYGAHLRTAIDAAAANFAPYEEQSQAYLSAATTHNLSVIYVASGSPPDILRFTDTAALLGMVVTTKNVVLENDPEFAHALAEMQSLTWDQQALIDYLVLLRSSHFGGTWASSFAWNIAFRRHVAVGHGIWKPSQAAENEGRDIKVRGDSEGPPGECYKDSVSTIYGDDLRGIWFELSMWP